MDRSSRPWLRAAPGVVALCVSMLATAQGPATRAASRPPFLGAVAEPSAADRARFQEQSLALQKLRAQLLDDAVPAAQHAALRAELDKVLAELVALKARDERWQRQQLAQRSTGGNAPDDFALLEQGALDLIAAFAKLVQQQAQGDTPVTGEAWEGLAARFAHYDPTMTRQIAAGTLDKAHGGDWLRRLLLLKGQCHLLASMAYFKARNPASDALHLDACLTGVGILEQVLALARPDNERLGDTSLASNLRLELVGCSTLEGQQLDTSQRCRELLGRFCPWGGAALRFFRDSGLLRRLDFRMVEPYGPASSAMGVVADVLAVTDRAAPKLSEGDLFGTEIPLHVEDELRALIGDRRFGEVVRGARREPLRWKWVQKDPVVKLWFVSPAVFRFGLQDAIEWSWRAVKLCFMGPWGLAVDEGIGIAGQQIGELLGDDHPVYAVTSLLVDGNDAGLDSQFVLGSEGLIDRKAVAPEFDWSALVRNLGTKMGEAFAKFEIECLFHGIDPQKTGRPPQTSYDGVSVPPVVLHGEVVGFDQVAPDEYQRVRRIVRFYQLDLAALAGLSGPYDLAARAVPELPLAKGYLAREPQAQARSWPILPTTAKLPLGRREYVTDFTPRAQVLAVQFDPESFKSWTTDQDGRPCEVELQLRTQGSPGKEVLTTKLHKPKLTLQLFDTHVDPTGTLAGQIGKRPGQLAEAGRAGVPVMRLPDADPDLVVPEQEPADVYATAPLKTAYDLVVRRRKVGQFLGERSLLVEPPRTETYFEELARIPLRWVSLRDPDTKAILPRTGTVKPHARKVGVTTMALDYSPGKLINVTPLPLTANYVDLLPPRLSVYGHSYEEVTGARRNPAVSYHLTHKGSELKVIGRLSGYGLKPGYYSAAVQMGPTRYVMWGQVRTPGGGAHLECFVSVPVGVTTLTATIPDLPPARLTIQRDPPDQPPQVDLAGLRANLDAAFQQFGNNPAQASKIGNACDAYANGLARLDRYREVYELYQSLFRSHPNWLSDLLKERLYDAAFRVGDARTVLRCGHMHTDGWIRDADAAFQRGDQSGARSAASSGAYTVKILLRRFVSTGGDAATAERLWQDLRRMEALGLTTLNSLAIYDELSIDFGPKERR